jgi:type III pantothenate kinase
MEILAVSIGNTRARIGHFHGTALESASAVGIEDVDALARAVLEVQAGPGTPVVIASVNTPARNALSVQLAPAMRERNADLYVFGRDLVIPIQTALSPEGETTVGQDRLLSALGAYSRAQQACIIVDAGTAITVDFVDGEGVFQGGAIAPGLNMMLASMHEHTAALPELRFEAVPDDQPFGKDTRSAMLLGAQSAARGLVRHLVERYSDAYGAYPQIVATGGDARTLFENDDLIEAIVPDLTLIGMQTACALQLAGEDGEDD